MTPLRSMRLVAVIALAVVLVLMFTADHTDPEPSCCPITVATAPDAVPVPYQGEMP